MFALTSGLNHSAVRRLKNSRDKLPVKYSKLLDDMISVMDPSMNFRRYRNLIGNATVRKYVNIRWFNIHYIYDFSLRLSRYTRWSVKT